MKYDSQAHITNNHPKHSLAHGYTHSNEYLGEVSSLNLVQGRFFDKLEAEGARVTYSSEYGQTMVHQGGWTGNAQMSMYENVYSQNGVILGSRQIS